MRHRDFYMACRQHDWGWRGAEDIKVRLEAASREHQLRRVAEESKGLRKILVKAEAHFWELRARRAQEVPCD